MKGDLLDGKPVVTAIMALVQKGTQLGGRLVKDKAHQRVIVVKGWRWSSVWPGVRISGEHQPQRFDFLFSQQRERIALLMDTVGPEADCAADAP